MAGINGLTGISSGITPVSNSPVTQKTGGKNDSFSKLLEKALEGIDSDQKSASTAIENLVTNKTDDPLSVVTEVAKADLSFKLLMGVRNKVVEAYKQTMNMQI